MGRNGWHLKGLCILDHVLGPPLAALGVLADDPVPLIGGFKESKAGDVMLVANQGIPFGEMVFPFNQEILTIHIGFELP